MIVPLLVMAGYGQRVASATSLAAIGVIALVGVILYGIRGEVEVGPALLVGLPAAAGAVSGAVLQQRLERVARARLRGAARGDRDQAARRMSGILLALVAGFGAGLSPGSSVSAAASSSCPC